MQWYRAWFYLQANETKIDFLVDEGVRPLKNILGHFVDADYIHSASDITKLNFKDPELQRRDSEMSIGRDARRYLEHLQELGEISPTLLEDL